MFTGIVETIGTVASLDALDTSAAGGGGTSLTIADAAEILGDVHLGDSICVNGTCLTVTEFTSSTFKVGVAPETLRRTNLGQLKVGDGVNLERAVAGHVRFGGHFVQGHVDTTARITSKTPDGNALTLRFEPTDASILVYVVEKGYIAIDGASLTVTAVDGAGFEVMLVAYTQEKIVVARKDVGESVNVEVDMTGKYIEKQVRAHLEGGLQGGVGRSLEEVVRGVVEREVTRRLGEVGRAV